ncbi:hypothetical protein A3A05_00220 [Candidatus Nomurabacteria bacterium RIFCSPLOWO2_01_FULL_41_12]|uniref:Uncharacterized protein n=1 Tax=Candidatus Nomurabacteria bacterium RIFCSPLOWO2_01_FULL_41_12 TaxID=1801774 RepID=A0A1F6WWV4_9BACT|nr:MAG: hypothetical protein A2732_00125 [Candidatus Nomurabacteria bacterium RIFCSPHIGHO2_01_FULL_40_10]OGI86359.1 MAG: hypothetical protein A3A05_00220 [Candidatus Nomurabacteria bacterium RIFCSPLOWO2_01_FULL_41_12]
MSKRNFVLLIIILITVVIAILGFLYFRTSPATPADSGTGTNFFSQFNPFGVSKPTPPPVKPPADVSGYEPVPSETEIQKLTKVSGMPIAGFTVFIKERLKDVPATTPAIKPLTEFIPTLRYVEKATGNIYQTFVDKIEERKYSKTIIPKVYEAYFGNRGEIVVMRYLKTDDRTIETFVGNLPKEYLGESINTLREVKGYFLPNDIKDISVSPDTSKIFYLFNLSDNNIIGATLNFSDNKKIQVFDSPFTEWLSQWPNTKTITLSTKPSSAVPGYMYLFDLDKKSLIKVLGDISGLTTLMSHNNKMALYGNNSLSLYIYSTDNGNSDILGVKTLPEKCVWGKANDFIYCAVPKFIDVGKYPDAWYQGEVSFSDQFWKIDAKNRNASLILDPAIIVGGEEIDGIKLALDGNENYLFFVNKKDSFLWKLDLK